MAEIENHSLLSAAELIELNQLMQTLASLGITPESIRSSITTGPNSSIRDEYQPLEDGEWTLLMEFLPKEPSQSNTMDNRAFVNAVLEATYRGGRWTEYPTKVRHSDAVRRRFGRWAHLGIWQRISDETSKCELSSQRKQQLKAAAERAERLRWKFH